MLPPFVDAAWLASHREQVVLADVRWYLDGRPGAAAFEEGHLPGAVFVDLDRWLSAPADPRHGRHPLPDPEVFAQGMRAVGIGDGATVVAYDDAGGVNAARLVWLLRVTGHDAAVLDGGLAAAGEPLETGPVTPAPAEFSARPWPAERLAGIDELGSGVLLDARARDRYAGEFEPVDPRPGHIPGARNLPAAEMLGPDTRLLPPAALRAQVVAAGVGEGDEVIASCGSGVTACHTLLVLETLGLPPGRLYPGSYSQWSNTDRPVEGGPGKERAMSRYAHVNLFDIDDSVAGRVDGLEGRFGRKHLESRDLGVSHWRYAPGYRAEMGHRHREQEEAYVVVAGSGEVLVDGEVRELRQWDVVRVAPEVVRAFAAGSEGLELIAVGGPKPEGGDGESQPVSWPG